MKPKPKRLRPMSDNVAGSGVVVESVCRTSDSNENSGLLLSIPLDVANLVTERTPGKLSPLVFPANVALFTTMGVVPALSATETV